MKNPSSAAPDASDHLKAQYVARKDEFELGGVEDGFCIAESHKCGKDDVGTCEDQGKSEESAPTSRKLGKNKVVPSEKIETSDTELQKPYMAKEDCEEDDTRFMAFLKQCGYDEENKEDESEEEESEDSSGEEYDRPSRLEILKALFHEFQKPDYSPFLHPDDCKLREKRGKLRALVRRPR